MTTPYPPEFFAAIAEGSRRSALRVLPHVFDLVAPRSVIDIGCGVGAWLNAADQLGVRDVVGVDGDYVDRTRLEIPHARFVAADLAGLTWAALSPRLPGGPRRFDLAISVEVAEHLPESAADAFIDLLCAAAPVVLFSAAVPFQGGTGHLNERFPSYWVPLFARRGLLPVDHVRRSVWHDEQVEWWYRQNLLLFATPQAIAARPALARARENTVESALDVIHPAHYRRVVEWGRDLWRQVHSPASGRAAD